MSLSFQRAIHTLKRAAQRLQVPRHGYSKLNVSLLGSETKTLLDAGNTKTGNYVAFLVATQVLIGLLRNSANGPQREHSGGQMAYDQVARNIAPPHSSALVAEELVKLLIAFAIYYSSKPTTPVHRPHRHPTPSDPDNTPLHAERASYDLENAEKAQLLHNSELTSNPPTASSTPSQPIGTPNRSTYPPGQSTPREPHRHESSPSPRYSSSSELLEEIERELGAPPGTSHHDGSSRQLDRRKTVLLIGLAFAYSIRDHATLITPQLAGDRTIHILGISTLLLVGLQSQLFLRRTITSQQWTSALLLMSALYIAQDFVFPHYTHSIFALLLALNWFASVLLLITDYFFKSTSGVPIHKLNLLLFTCTFLASAVVFAFSGRRTPDSDSPAEVVPQSTHWNIKLVVIVVLRAVSDILTLFVLKYSSAFVFCIASLLSATIVFPLSLLFCQSIDASPISTLQIVACVVGMFAAWSSLISKTTPESGSKPPNASPQPCWPASLPQALFAVTLLFPLGFVLLTSPILPSPPLGPSGLQESRSVDYLFAPPLPPIVEPVCSRRPLPPSSTYAGDGDRTFREFDDILVVVFFSHARYDINLDWYRKVYSEYFPNIVFIGPASREDRGFKHSYDVVVDSYQSDEDLNGSWYKMSGRMAHHMMYTAVKDYPCYKGYLWAPFDAFLNIPRLAQFDQTRIWYHSPYGEIVPNPAVNDNLVPPPHPPPATVSNQTIAEYVKNYHSFGSNDGWNWWWGEPHVGLEVCWRAYERVPQHMRDRLAAMTNEPDRFIGGSADTLYIPGNLRDSFLEVLGLFLETDCFLEIALPTTLHLILPPDETIQFVDHWWIWMPPLNATFVRNMWAEGYEVDSFHTFHWGDKGEDGIWRPNEHSVEDVRALLRDSFVRQRMETP